MNEDDNRERLRKAFEEELDSMIARAKNHGFVVSIRPCLTAQGQRYYTREVRHARGFYPKEK